MTAWFCYLFNSIFADIPDSFFSLPSFPFAVKSMKHFPNLEKKVGIHRK